MVPTGRRAPSARFLAVPARNVMIRAGLMRGFHDIAARVLSGTRGVGLTHALRLRRLFKDLGIQTVFDVGANLGQFHDFLRDRVAFGGRIISFEPVPANVAHLQARCSADAAWTVHACALGAETGRADINIMASSLFSSFRQPARDNDAVFTGMNKVVGTASVEVNRLDDMVPSDIDLSRTFVKLDTQGFDLEVLKGGPKTLAAAAALQTEVSFRPLYDGVPTYQESLAAFESCGFSVADLFLVAEDGDHVAMEFDCVMVRRDKGRNAAG